jgi:ribosomal protein L11 methyltransferase
MPWLRLEIRVEAPFAEALSDALLELGAQSVTIEDARADTPDEIPRFGEPGFDCLTTWRDNKLCAIVDMQSEPRALIQAAASVAGLRVAPEFAQERIDDADWVRRTQSQFSSLRVGERLWIVPSWRAPPSSHDALVVRLDPGVAFGTGSHATTRLMLAWLESALSKDAPTPSSAISRVLDYGCGSGILALAAAKLGAPEVVAIDVDPGALAACAGNALANAVSIRIEPPERLPAGAYDLVLANILARPLIELAPVFAAHTRQGARIGLCGVLAEQAVQVIAAYSAEFEMRIEAMAEDWALVTGERR